LTSADRQPDDHPLLLQADDPQPASGSSAGFDLRDKSGQNSAIANITLWQALRTAGVTASVSQ
jgi:hypothetical protein